jgi:hypothetical protein
MIRSLAALLIKVGVLIISFATTGFSNAATNMISLAQVTKDISYLASDGLKGRDNYSPEIQIAASYIANRFQENGLVASDGISGTDFLQKYQITKVTPEQLKLTINGQKISSDNLVMASTVPNFSWLMNSNTKNTEFKVQSIGKNDDMRAIINRLNKQGGKHLVLLNPAHKDLFERYRHYLLQGTTKLTPKNTSKNSGGIIVITLSTIPVDEIKNLSASGVSSIRKNELANVVAILPGKTKPEEIVLYSAHYDHLGVKPGEEGVIYNGADDDASGTTAIINLAQYYAKQGDNARTLMFAAFSAEEIGGFGSKYLSQQLEPHSITAMINIEMIGKPSKFGTGTMWMTGMERSDLGEKLNEVLAKSGKKIYKDPYPEQELFYRSDNATLARLGVPAHSFSSAQLDNDQHYHQISDDVASLNLESFRQVIEMLTIATQPLVNGSITPSRIDKNAVKKKGVIF